MAVLRCDQRLGRRLHHYGELNGEGVWGSHKDEGPLRNLQNKNMEFANKTSQDEESVKLTSVLAEIENLKKEVHL